VEALSGATGSAEAGLASSHDRLGAVSDVPVGAAVAVAAYRIALEAITNASRHAAADTTTCHRDAIDLFMFRVLT